jgi:hypothetical protein
MIWLWTGLLLAGLMAVGVLLLSLRRRGVEAQVTREDGGGGEWSGGDAAAWPPEAEVLHRLYRLVQRYFRSVGQEVKFEEGVVQVEIDGTKTQLGLQNLAQVLAGAAEQEHEELVRRHFEGVVNATRMFREFQTRVGEFEFVRKLLTVRLMPENPKLEAGLVARRDLPGVMSVLCFDLPDSVVSVTNDLPRKWGRSADELFAVALDNVEGNYPVHRSEDSLAGGVRVHTRVGDHYFAATWALLLDREPEQVGTEGSLLIVPTRHLLMVHPVRDASATAAMEKLAGIAVGLHREGPGSVSAKLYYFREGAFAEVPFTVGKNRFEFQIPEALAAALAKVSG